MAHGDDRDETNQRCVLKREAIDAMPGRDKVHFLDATARRHNLSLGDATGLTGLGIHLVTLPPGSRSTAAHVHHHEDEAAYVLEGRGEVELDDAVVSLGPGDFVGMPAGGPAHVFVNRGREPLKMLVIGQRLAHDVADYPRLGKRLYRNAGVWNLVDHDAITDPKAAPGSTVGSK